MRITLAGMEDAEKQLRRIRNGTKNLGNYAGVVGSKLPYAYGIEFGTHRKSGRVARKGGGVQYLTRAMETVLAGADADLSEGLKKVTAPGPWVLRRLALWARRVARANAPRGPKNKTWTRRAAKRKAANPAWKPKGAYRLHKSITYKVRKGG